jgi:hypothetical protein
MVRLEKLIVIQVANIFLPPMEPEYLLPCVQKPLAGHYPERPETSPYLYTLRL